VVSGRKVVEDPHLMAVAEEAFDEMDYLAAV